MCGWGRGLKVRWACTKDTESVRGSKPQAVSANATKRAFENCHSHWKTVDQLSLRNSIREEQMINGTLRGKETRKVSEEKSQEPKKIFGKERTSVSCEENRSEGECFSCVSQLLAPQIRQICMFKKKKTKRYSWVLLFTIERLLCNMFSCCKRDLVLKFDHLHITFCNSVSGFGCISQQHLSTLDVQWFKTLLFEVN